MRVSVGEWVMCCVVEVSMCVDGVKFSVVSLLQLCVVTRDPCVF